MENVELLKKELEGKRSSYEHLCKTLIIQLEYLLKEEDIKLGFPIEWRVKDWNSFYEKCERNGLKLFEVAEMNDIAGVRMIGLLRKDVEKAKRIIEKNFIIHNQENTFERLGQNQFGYGSIHYELSLKGSWLSSPTHNNLRGLNVELQLRTAPQHIWAAVSHIFQYKKEQDVPQRLRRSINRIAALLETVDNEFERIFLERQEFLSETTNNKEKRLDKESLVIILDKYLPSINKRNDEPYSILLDELFRIQVFTVEALEKIIKKHLVDIINSDKEKVITARDSRYFSFYPDETKEKINQGAWLTHAGLLRGILTKEFGKKFSSHQETKNIISKNLPNT